MKRFVTILLALAMLASMGSVAYAADGSDQKDITSTSQTESAEIYGIYKSAAEPEPVYSVNISWQEMKFYYKVVNPEWMPSVHRYDGEREFVLASGNRSRKITVSNSSNRKVLDLCQYFGQKKSKDYAAFFSSSSSFCCGVK